MPIDAIIEPKRFGDAFFGAGEGTGADAFFGAAGGALMSKVGRRMGGGGIRSESFMGDGAMRGGATGLVLDRSGGMVGPGAAVAPSAGRVARAEGPAVGLETWPYRAGAAKGAIRDGAAGWRTACASLGAGAFRATSALCTMERGMFSA